MRRTRMKRFYFLTTVAALGVGMVAGSPALAFDGQATPQMLLDFSTTPLSLCLDNKVEGYPIPGGDGCGYLDAGPRVIYFIAPPEALRSGRSVAIGQTGGMCSTLVNVCKLRHEAFFGTTCSCKTAGGRAPGTVTR